MTRNACEMCALRETSRTLDACILLSCLPQKLYLRSQLFSMKRTSVRKVGKLTFLAFALCWSQFALSLSKPAEEEVSDLVLRVSKPLDTEHHERSGKNQKGLLNVWKDKLYKNGD